RLKKWNLGFCHNSLRNKIRIPVEATALLFILICNLSNASTGSSWSQQPSWNSGNPDNNRPTHRSSTRSTEPSGGEVSPFSPGSNNIALDLGQVFLMGDLTKFTDSLGVQIHYTYGVSELFAFDASVGYSEHSNAQFSMVTVLSGMRLNLAW